MILGAASLPGTALPAAARMDLRHGHVGSPGSLFESSPASSRVWRAIEIAFELCASIHR